MTAASSHSIDHREEPQVARRRLGRAALAALAGLAAFAAQAAMAQVGTRLEKVELQSQPGEQLEVRLVLDGPAPQPMALHDRQPGASRRGPAWHYDRARIAPDRRQCWWRRHDRRRRRPRAARASCSTMDALQPYQTRVDGNTVYVTLGQGVSPAASAAPAAQSAAVAAAPSSGASIEKIDFRRGSDGAGPRPRASERSEVTGEPQAGRRPDRHRPAAGDARRRAGTPLTTSWNSPRRQLVDVTRTAAWRPHRSWPRPATSSSSPTRSGPRLRARAAPAPRRGR